ncbi:hypothetical protein HYR99_03715 [Candidatus Poribacteria bacterium]|nr:hypothetical protein [Candidatus Poribacteria bacterium]
MTYEEILEQAPKEYCQRVARRMGLSDRLPILTLRQKISQMLLNAESLETLVGRLNHDERSVLTMLAFSCGTMGVPFHLFNRKLNQLSRSWHQTIGEILRILTESGFIFTRAVGKMQYHYIIPDDLRALLLKIFANEMNATLASPKEMPQSVRNDGFALIRDTFTFLCFASQYGIKLTQQQAIYKRTQQSLLSRFEVAEDTPKIYHRINPTDGNPDRLDFIYQFCWRRKLIKHDQPGIRCSRAGQAWVRKSDAEKIVDIYNDWVECCVSGNLPIVTAHSILQILQPERWVLLSSIQEQVSKFAPDAIWTQTLYSQLERSFINHLTYMGAVAFASLRHDIAIQVTDLGRRLLSGENGEVARDAPEMSFILQPNYEILASNYLAPELRWTLGHIGELNQANQIATYYGQLYFMDVMLLRCKSEHLAQELKSSKQIGKYILGEISTTDLIVSRRKFNDLRVLLEKQNHMPLPEVVTFETE